MAAAFASAAFLASPPAFAGTPDADALRPWTAAAPPPVTLPQLGSPQGSIFAVADEPADAILLHFFASWCEPCREELPALERLSGRGAPRLKVVAIAVADNEARLRRVADEAGVTFPILMDSDRAVARAWSISALPSTVILDSQRQARLIVESDYAWDKIEPMELIERLSSPAKNIHAQQSVSTQGGH